MQKTKFCQGISDISDTYMGFIIDQWGTLHNGEKAYDGVLECLKELKSRKKFVIILSNSSETAAENKQKLKNIGIGPSLYTAIMTPGELITEGIRDNKGVFSRAGKKCYCFSATDDIPMLKDTGVEIVKDVKDAEFMLIIGADAPLKSVLDYDPLLREAVKRGLPAYCANPDSRALLGATFVMGPGLIARRYQDFGGVVHYIGKPHQPIYHACIELMQTGGIYPGQIVTVGDTMAHDILGGWAAEIDTCLVRNGLHASSFRNAKTLAETDMALDVLCAQYNNVKPRYLIKNFLWGRALPDRKHKKHKKHAPRRGRPRKIDKS